jgi:hypothetical protein
MDKWIAFIPPHTREMAVWTAACYALVQVLCGMGDKWLTNITRHTLILGEFEVGVLGIGTGTGRYIVVVWEHVLDDPWTIRPVTAYDVPPPRTAKKRRGAA